MNGTLPPGYKAPAERGRSLVISVEVECFGKLSTCRVSSPCVMSVYNKRVFGVTMNCYRVKIDSLMYSENVKFARYICE